LPSDFDVAGLFELEFAKAIAEEWESSGYPPSEWASAGRWNDQGREFWEANGPVYVQNFIDWYESQPDVSVWITPDGEPAVELDLSADLHGIPVRVVIDSVLTFGKTNPALVVIDVKSGSTRPDNARQLAIAASVIEKTYGIRPRYGAFFMARGTGKGKPVYFQPPVELTGPEHSGKYLGGEFRMFDLSANGGIFPARPGDHCRRCPVAYACAEMGGPLARMYDRHHPDFTPTGRK
jgi:putative RecB family exonuclease